MSAAPVAPLVTFIVVAWNSGRVLPACLGALAAQTSADYELIVVDNGSDDGGVEGVERNVPNTRVLRQTGNTGFAAGNNLAAGHARGRWLALVNSDAFLAPDWLERMLAAAADHPECAFFASRLLQNESPGLLDGAGDTYHLSGLAWRRGYGRPAAGPFVAPSEVFGPCAAAALYDRQAFLSAGGFDEDFGSYYEDVDLAFRLRLSGHRCLYVPDAVARHVGSATLGKLSDTAIYLTHRNLEWTWFRDMPLGLLLWSLPAHALMDLAYLTRYSLTGHASAIWRAKVDALLGLRRALRKRRDTQRQRRAPVASLYRAMDTGILSPYLPSLRLRLDRMTVRPAGPS